MVFFYLIFYSCMRLRFLDVKICRPVAVVGRLLRINVWGLTGNLSDLTVASSHYEKLLCSETLVSDMRDVSEFLVSRFVRPVLCRGKMHRAR